MKTHIGQNIRILITGLCCVLLLVGVILSMIPEKDLGLSVKEELKASFSRITLSESRYSCEVIGRLENERTEPLLIERLEILVGSGDSDTTHLLEQTNVTLPPRATLEVFERWESDTSYDRVLSVKATVGGETAVLSNASQGGVVNGLTLILLGLLLLCGYLLWRAVKIRYYMEQEDRQKALDAEAKG